MKRGASESLSRVSLSSLKSCIFTGALALDSCLSYVVDMLEPSPVLP